MVIVDELGKGRTEEPAGTTGHGRRQEGAGEGAAGRHHRTAGDNGADVHQPADQAALRITDGFQRDVSGAWHPWVVLQLRHLAVAVAELFFDCVLACEQAELGTVEAGAEQLVDRLLKGIGVMEDADRLADRSSRTAFAFIPHRLLRSIPYVSPRSRLRREIIGQRPLVTAASPSSDRPSSTSAASSPVPGRDLVGLPAREASLRHAAACSAVA